MTNEPVSIPVAIGGMLSTAVAMAALLWPERLTPELSLAIIALGNAIIAFGVAVYARARVTPIDSPRLVKNSMVMVTSEDDEPLYLKQLA
jgi:hypothetical protein